MEDKVAQKEENPARETQDRMQSKSLSFAATPDESRDAEQDVERECDSATPLFSLKTYLRRSSSSTSADSLTSSQQSSSVDCAEFVLKCLFCRFYDMILMFPDSCKRAVNHCCPGSARVVTDSPGDDDDDSFVDFGCDFFDSCHEAGDCLELAMEISQLCYH